MKLPKLLVFASGSAEGGGSGFEKLVRHAAIEGELQTQIVGVVSNHEHGGVRQRAERLNIPFTHFPPPYTAEAYQRIAVASGAEFFALSGWIKLVTGLDPNTPFNPCTVFNIHPGPLPNFGGQGMYGHHVHKAVMGAYRRGEIQYSSVSMHFVTELYDRGPVFLNTRVIIHPLDTVESLAERVNEVEHEVQARITDLVTNKHITWDGENPSSLHVPEGYQINRYA